MLFLVSCQEPNGNFPYGTHKVGKKSSIPSLTQFCHGAPGAISCLLEAALFFPNYKEVFYKSAVMGCEHIWDYGLCRKGYGLCHGIPGNAYPFLG